MSASATVTTATEVNTITITGIVRVLCSEAPTVFTLINTGIPITVSNVSLAIEYV